MAFEVSSVTEGDINYSPLRKKWQDGSLSPEAKAILSDDNNLFLHQSLSTPCLNALRACEGAWIEDVDGNRYLDFHGNAVHQVGFRNPEVVKAVKEQLDTLPFCTRRYTNHRAVELAGKLVARAPGDLSRVLFAPGGTEAIGIALKLARLATGKFKTLSLWESYHGSAMDALSVSGQSFFRKGLGPLLSGAEHVPPPEPLLNPWPDVFDPESWAIRSVDYLDYVLEREGGEIGAVVAETVRSTPYFPPKEYWQAVRDACDRHHALLILDEIPSCLGRTGHFYACDYYDIVPDLLVVGKGLGGGMFPLAAVLTSDELNVDAHGAVGHYTHEKSPLAATAACATIDYIDQHQLLDQCRQLGAAAMDHMRGLQQRFPIISEIRGRGLMLGIVLGNQSGINPSGAVEELLYRALSKGLSFKTTMGCVIQLTPPLTITLDELALAFDALHAAFEDFYQEHGL
jgi:4-aminobutyrate aminotransferase